MAFDTASDALQNSEPAPGRGPPDIEPRSNAEQQFNFRVPILNTKQSGSPEIFSSDPFMGDGEDLSALLGDLPAGRIPAEAREMEQIAKLRIA